MSELNSSVAQWLSGIIGGSFNAHKHVHAHQDEVYKIEAPARNYYLKIAQSLRAERDNLNKLGATLTVPKVIDFYSGDQHDYLLISELPGQNLVELIGEWPDTAVVETFAKAVRRLHSVDVTAVFPEASAQDVLVHGDMALPNIIISAQGGVGYIDWGQLSYGTAELDLADALWSLQRNLGPDYGVLFLEKYGPLTMTPKIDKALKFRYKPVGGGG